MMDDRASGRSRQLACTHANYAPRRCQAAGVDQADAISAGTPNGVPMLDQANWKVRLLASGWRKEVGRPLHAVRRGAHDVHVQQQRSIDGGTLAGSFTAA